MKIVLLHGLYMHGIVMQPLSQKLRKLGYISQVITYNTLAIDEEKVFRAIDKAIDPSMTNVLVGHSLGGLMIKHYLAQRKPSVDLISHAVAIGSPLQGASIVHRLQDLGLGAILGNATDYGLENHQDEWCYPQKLGSIAGNVALGARPILMMENDTLSDGTVTVEETRIQGMTDHIITGQTHTSIIYSRFVPEQIDHFIQHSSFQHE
ncbi:cobinamide adenolsyltransferase [Vibrio sonorensis]|uniref:cobinamide adenolsyltransferase n=1 Tax=Vibrio sonorensis TaxID=1004316 RepID=UPI0008D9B748|nr:cobinamide adenolsyltransferase [Vibrio sonorensis]